MQTENVTEQDILKQAQALPEEMTPSRDLWSGIEQAVSVTPQVSNESQTAWTSKIAAAFVPFALIAGMYFGQSAPVSEDAPWLQPVVASFEMQKQQALRQVSEETVVTENWQMSLKELEEAEASLMKALKQQPDDPALMKMLTQVYQQQINLIQKAHRPQLQRI
jgi:hypothetical protein